MRGDLLSAEMASLIVGGVGCLVLARLVLRPIHQAARDRGKTPEGRWRPVQFHTGDLFFLFLYVALGLGIVAAADRLIFRNLPSDDISLWEIQLFGCAMGFFTCLWWLGIRLLSRAVVRRRSRRVQFLFALPMIYLAAFLLVWVPIYGVVADRRSGGRLDSCAGFVCSAVVFGPFLFALHRVVVWVASPEKKTPIGEETSRADEATPRAPEG
ncbi:MAG: hypothetical protein HYS13_02410 [Planctomycetia bacterium]|nr:hypothetical protein [Planctomycetia bacterium]